MVDEDNLQDIPTSVIVCTMSGRLDLLKQTIRSILGQSKPPIEIIIVTDPIDVEALEEIRSECWKGLPDRHDHFLRVCASEEMGLSNARNKGIEVSKGKAVAFIDDDAEADPKWLENLTRHFSDQRVVGVGGRIKPMWGEGLDRPSWLDISFDWLIGCTYLPCGELTQIDNPMGCNMAFRRDVLEKFGYFKSEMGRRRDILEGCEETELGRRLLRKIPGSLILYDPGALVSHTVSGERRAFRYGLRRAYREGISKAKITQEGKNMVGPEKNYLTYIFFRRFPTMAVSALRGRNLKRIPASCLLSCAVMVGFVSGKIGR